VQAKPTVGAPRTLDTAVGEQKGIRLLSDDARGRHWIWLRQPSRRIVVAHVPQRLPENEEAVNGLPGRTGVYVTGRRVGTTTGLLGYVSRDGSRLLKTVLLRIVVQ
jgi:hypothetical protein